MIYNKILTIGLLFLLFCSIVIPICLGYNVKTDIKIDLEKRTRDGLMESPWPMYGHDFRHTGRSPYGSPGNYFVEKWKVRLDKSVFYTTSPVIAKDGTIYLASGHGIDTLYAINPNGIVKWKYKTQEYWGEIFRTPCLAEDGTIYLRGDDENFYAFNPNGTIKWIIKIQKEGISSPTIGFDGTIYIGGGYSLYAVNPNGTIKWEFETEGIIRTSPAIDDNGIVYISSFDGYLYAINPNDGTLKWRFLINSHGTSFSSPVIGDDGNIYVLGGYKLWGIYPNGIDNWMLMNYGIIGPTINNDGTLYVHHGSGGSLKAISPDGELKWKTGSYGFTSRATIDKNGNIYISGYSHYGDQVGRLYQISPDGKILASIVPSCDFNYDTCEIRTTPAISEDGTIYIGSDFWRDSGSGHDYGYLHAFEIKNIKNNPPNPPIVVGPTEGKSYENHTFTISTSDPDGDNISFYIKWGGAVSPNFWTDYISSNDSINVSNKWYYRGKQDIEVWAQDIYGGMSEIVTFEILISRTRASLSAPWLRFLDMFPILQRILQRLR